MKRTIAISHDDLDAMSDFAEQKTRFDFSEPLEAVRQARSDCAGKLRVLFCPQPDGGLVPARAAEEFADADEVVFIPPEDASGVERASADVADFYFACRACEGKGPRLLMARNRLEAWEHVANSEEVGDAALSLGAGEAPLRKASRRRIWIGQGSNTWKSDLNLCVDYVKTSGPAEVSGATLGIPWMAGIPGTVGGWIKMNAGAFGHSISEVVEAVKVDGEWRTAAACGFAYRHSDIDGEIQDVKWREDELKAAKARFLASEFLSRRKAFPPGTYGSFFKNPEGDHAGRLLEEAGAKALRVGGAYVWSEHANVIVRGEGATSSDVLALARLMRRFVLLRFGVSLEPEVQGIEF